MKRFPQPQRRALRLMACAVLACCAVSTAQAQFGGNLLVNGGADAGPGGDGGAQYAGNLPGWTVGGQMMAIAYAQGCPGGYPCLTDPVPPNAGINHFAGGNAAVSTARQSVDLGFASSAINGAGAYYKLSGWLGGYASQTDNMVLSVSFKGADNQVLGLSTIGPVSADDRGNLTAMLLREASGFAPAGAVSADVLLQSNRTGGSSNDGYADQLSFSLLPANVSISTPGTVAVGSSFTAQVAVLAPFAGAYSGDELLAFGFDLDFDHSKLQLTGVQLAAGWDDDSAMLSGVSVAGSHFPGVADAGQSSLALATLTFKVLAEGDVDISVLSDSTTNLNEGLTYAGASNLELLGHTRLTLAPVPEPGTLALMGCGGLLLVLRRRRG